MIENHLALVKGQINWLRSQVARFTPDHPRYRPEQVALYQRLIRQHEDLLVFLQSQVERHEPARPTGMNVAVPQAPPVPVLNDLSDLPQELLAELSEGVTKGESDPLIEIINGHGGTASIDQILIDLWRKHHEIGKRTLVSNKLYRLSKRGLVWAMPGKKGIYTTSPQSKAEQAFEATSDALVTVFGRPQPVKQS